MASKSRAQKRTKPKEQTQTKPFKKAQKRFADCSVCTINLRSFEGRCNGIICPPCLQETRRIDMIKRQKYKKKSAIAVPVEGEPFVIDYDTFDRGSFIGGTASIIYRSKECFQNEKPILNAYFNDCSNLGSFEYNERASRIINGYGIFAENHVNGNMIVVGPNDASLHDHEIKLLLAL